MAKILVVDDDPQTLEFVKRALGEDHEVFALEDWTELNNYIYEHEIDLILLDINMPSIFTGDKVANMLKNSVKGKALNIVLFSAMDEYALRQKAKEVGANGYISKTFDEKLLRIRVRRYLK